MNIYIDESGSMTHDIVDIKNKYFIIAVLLVLEPEKLKRVYSRFVIKNLSMLKSIDVDNKMFINDKFHELKGYAFTPELKRQFVGFFCRNNYFKLLCIKVDNSLAYTNLYKNKARAFNYILKLSFEHITNKKILIDRVWNLNIDERNVKTEAKYNLKELLYTDLCTGKNVVDDINVKYFDSSNNKLIQVADIFANILYSDLVTNGNYTKAINFMSDNGYLLNTFVFPPI